MTTILLVLLLVATLGLSLEVWRLRRGNGKNNEVTREQIDAQLRDLVWADFEEGNYRAQTGLPLDAYIQDYGGKYLASGSPTTLTENDIARLMPTIDDAKK